MGKRATALFAGAILMLCFSSVQAALESRLGGQAYYDTTMNITWLTNANLAASNTFGVGGINADGTMPWDTANSWITAMNAAGGTGYLGFNNWRLPTMLDTGTSGCDSAFTGTDCGYNVQTGSAATTVYSELASLWYDTLGNLAWFDTSGNPDQPGWGLSNTGPFSNLQSYNYWSGLEYAPVTNEAWMFIFGYGNQTSDDKSYDFHAWAVQSGDVGAVPVPAAVWLFGSALLGLIGAGRLRQV